jgi:hypothetical protein
MWPLCAAAVVAAGCAHEGRAGAERDLELGSRQVRVSAPAGWELLDQGAVKRFRKGESQIALQNLGPAAAPVDLAAWGRAALADDDERRALKSSRAVTVDSQEAVEVETWSRLDHAWPQRFLFVRIDDDVVALHTPGRADDDVVKAFDAIRDSLHFPSSARR